MFKTNFEILNNNFLKGSPKTNHRAQSGKHFVSDQDLMKQIIVVLPVTRNIIEYTKVYLHLQH